MADKEEKPQQSQQPSTQNTFDGGMVKDPLDLFKKANSYVHARNMVNNLPDGQIGGKNAEPSTVATVSAPYTIIGRIYLDGDQWVIFSTNNTYSEIGILNDTGNTANDTYVTLMNDVATVNAGLPGLNFNTANLITGEARRGFECGYDVYWSDGQRNPDRKLNTASCPYNINARVDPNPWIQNCTTSGGCVTCVNTDKIDADQLRIAPLFSTPCLKLSKHAGSGQLSNGSYQVCMAFAQNGIKCTDYIAFSDVYSTFNHLNNGGSFDCAISNIDDITKVRFPEMELVVISMVNEQIQAKRLGIYSTNQSVITIDLIDQSLPNISIDRLTISNPAIVSSDAIFRVSDMLTRVGPKERPDFNYQPLANKIVANWAAIKYPEDYYQKGGNEYGMNVGYRRGERYAFYIRWVYSTGDKSASYPIPGLPSGTAATLHPANTWPSVPGGTVIAAGRFAGYSSTDIYPDNQPLVYGALCGKPIMHHEFPDQASFSGSTLLSHYNPGQTSPSVPGQLNTISVLGAYFTNILPPVDNNGNIITDIVGYEILRAVRDGHEHIVANGMINNMRPYSSTGNGPIDGVFQNYPYNDLPTGNGNLDWYLTTNVANINSGATGNGARDQLSGYMDDMFSFHSPDTVFNHPYLGLGSLEAVMSMSGISRGKFIAPYKHPLFRLPSDLDSILVDIITAVQAIVSIIDFTSVVAGNNPPEISMAATEDIPFNMPIVANMNGTIDILGTDTSNAGKWIAVAANATFLSFFTPLKVRIFSEQMLQVIKGLIPARQYAMQYNSFGFYSYPQYTGRIGAQITNYQYIRDQMQNFAGYTVNNLYRNDYVAIKTAGRIPARFFDRSRYNIGPYGCVPINQWHTSRCGIPNTIDSYYAAYKVNQSAQYGQIDSTKQVPIGCIQQVSVKTDRVFSSPVFFGGDTYINRYTEKNPFFFFNDWLIDLPKDYKYDYRNYINVPYPMFWINNDVINYSLIGLAHKNRRLDGPMNMHPFYVGEGYFYLFCNGMRDFFVESGVNVGYRDWEEPIAKRFYDPYGSSDDFINDYLRSDIIKSNILYKYDYSLSANRFVNQYMSWSQCLRRDYNPDLAYTCFSYYPRRLVYSLPQEEEQMFDNWSLFLPNNYKNFNDKIWSIKDIHKTGALFLMENSTPFMFAGSEVIPSKSGTDYTVGSGQLFRQTLQSCGNVDDSYEHGSNQSRLAVVNTPYGVFWASQSTGKLYTIRENRPFDFGENAGLKYWLLKYLPSQLLQYFPDFPLADNPVAGVGVQMVYDSSNSVLYICKKDYVPNVNLGVTYTGGQWELAGVRIEFGDPRFFTDASWTLSYDCRKEEFISFHDWHPSITIPSKNNFLSVNGGGQIWRHGSTVQSFCNFYNQDYPCEIEYFTNTQTVETVLQSVEWLLESYQYAPNGVDRFLNFDGSFNYMMISNREQNSTLQEMSLKPWDNPYAVLNYPQFVGPVRNILYNKVENKYRANDFYDYTKDRGQFTLANVPMRTTDPNGYTFTLNAPYFDLNKPWNQLKRFRFTGTSIFMRKTSLGKNSLTLRYANTKNQFSPR